MEVFFSDKKMCKICADSRLLKKHYGQNANKIEMRLFELYSVDNLSQVPTTPPPRCHMLTGNREGQFAVDIQHPFRIVFVPAVEPIPRKADGGIDLERVTAVEIIWIGDYHGE